MQMLLTNFASKLKHSERKVGVQNGNGRMIEFLSLYSQ